MILMSRSVIRRIEKKLKINRLIFNKEELSIFLDLRLREKHNYLQTVLVTDLDRKD